MKFFWKIICVYSVFSTMSCVTEEITKKPPEKSGKTQAHSWAIDKLPTLETREDFEDYILRLKFGNESETRQVMVGLQLKMDMCLPFIIKHLEDQEKFGGVDFPLVSNKGFRLTDVSIPANKYTIGSALEMLLVSYFYKDPARTTFHVTRRENAVEVWENWYSRRRTEFRWNSWGLYSNK